MRDFSFVVDQPIGVRLIKTDPKQHPSIQPSPRVLSFDLIHHGQNSTHEATVLVTQGTLHAWKHSHRDSAVARTNRCLNQPTPFQGLSTSSSYILFYFDWLLTFSSSTFTVHIDSTCGKIFDITENGLFQVSPKHTHYTIFHVCLRTH